MRRHDTERSSRRARPEIDPISRRPALGMLGLILLLPIAVAALSSPGFDADQRTATGWFDLAGEAGSLAPAQFPTPTPPFPTLIPTEPLPTLPPNVPTPALHTPTPTTETMPTPITATITPTVEPSPTRFVTPSPTSFLGLLEDLYLPLLQLSLGESAAATGSGEGSSR